MFRYAWRRPCHLASRSRIGPLRIPLRYIVYLLPAAFLVGTNVKVSDAADRPIYIGASELVITSGVFSLILVRLMRNRRVWVPRSVGFWVVAFSAVVLLSNPVNVVFGRWNTVSVSAIVEVLRWFEYLAVLPIISGLITRPRQFRPILLVAFVCLMAHAAVTLYQAATFDFSQARPYGLVRSASDVEGLSVSNPNTAGTLLMIGSLYLLAFVLEERHVFGKVALIGALLASLGAMLFTLSRSSVLGFGVGALTMPFIFRRTLGSRLKAATVVGLAVLVGLYFVVTAESLSARVANSLNLTSSSTEALSILERLSNWRTTLQGWNDYFLLGIGFGRFRELFDFMTPDNLYLELFATTGVVGLVAFLGMILALGRSAMQLESFSVLVAPLKAGYLASLSGLIVVSVTGGVLLAPRVSGLFWLLSGIMIKLSEWQQADAEMGAVTLEPVRPLRTFTK